MTDQTITRATVTDFAAISAFYTAHQGPMGVQEPLAATSVRRRHWLREQTRRVECVPCGAILIVEGR